MSDKLKSCPFCGSKKIHLVDASDLGYNWIHCDNCSAEGPCKLTAQEAIYAWQWRRGKK